MREVSQPRVRPWWCSYLRCDPALECAGTNNTDSVTVSATKADPNAVMSGDVTAGTSAATMLPTHVITRSMIGISLLFGTLIAGCGSGS